MRTLPPELIRLGVPARVAGLIFCALAMGSATLTFDWIVVHRPELNYVGEFAGAVLYPSDIMLLAGVGFWGVGWLLSPGLKLRYGPLYVFLPLLILVVLASYSGLWAIYSTQAGFVALRRLLLLGLFVVMATDAAKALLPVLASLFGFGLVHAAVGMGQVAVGSPLGLELLGEMTTEELLAGGVGDPRAYGLGFNPNPVGLFLSVVSVLAYSLFLLRRFPKWAGAGIIGVFGFSLLGLVATDSRSALLGWLLAVILVSAVALYRGRENQRIVLNKLRSLAVFVFLLAVLAISASTVPGILNRPGTSSTAMSGLSNVLGRYDRGAVSAGILSRVSDWRPFVPVIKDHWAFGVGAGNAPVALKEAWIPQATESYFVPAHNVLILMLVELGILGAAAWAAIMAAPLLWLISERPRPAADLGPLLWLGPLLVLLLVSLVEFSPWATQDARLLFTGIVGLWAGSLAAGKLSTK